MAQPSAKLRIKLDTYNAITALKEDQVGKIHLDTRHRDGTVTIRLSKESIRRIHIGCNKTDMDIDQYMTDWAKKQLRPIGDMISF